jgi:hypothetical protein
LTLWLQQQEELKIRRLFTDDSTDTLNAEEAEPASGKKSEILVS